MKTTVKELSEKLKKIKGFVPPKLDMIPGILYDKGTLIASNSELTVKTVVADTNILIEERFIIPPKAVDFILTLPVDNDVELIEENSKIKVKSGKTKSTFATTPPDEVFPGETDTKIDNWIRVTPASSLTISERMKKILHCCSVDSTKAIYTGIRFDVRDDSYINLVTCDGFRIAITQELVAPSVHSFSVAAKDIKSVLALEGPEGIDIYQTDNKAKFVTGDYEIYTRLLSGEFINYQSTFIKTEPNAKLFFDQKTVVNCIERAIVCIGKEKCAVNLKTDTGVDGVTSLHLITQTPDSNSDEELKVVENISGQIDSDYNAQFLIQAFKACGDNQITFNYFGKESPVTIISNDLKQMILPVRQRKR